MESSQKNMYIPESWQPHAWYSRQQALAIHIHKVDWFRRSMRGLHTKHVSPAVCAPIQYHRIYQNTSHKICISKLIL